MAGATAWGSCDAITSGNDISSNNCVTDGHRYIQYQLSMSTTDENLSPLVDDITINYDLYQAAGREELDRIKEEIKEDEGTDYFFTS